MVFSEKRAIKIFLKLILVLLHWNKDTRNGEHTSICMKITFYAEQLAEKNTEELMMKMLLNQGKQSSSF